MSEQSGMGTRPIDRSMVVRGGLAVGVLVIVGAVLGSSLLTTRPPTATQVAGTTRPSTDATAPSTTPGPTDEPWVALGSGSYEPTAELTPTDRDRVGAATTTAFTLRSFTDTPAVELARSLVTNPPVALSVEAGTTPDVAVIRPAAPLAPSTRYRFRLESDGVVEGSWIYVTRGPLHVTGTLPGDKAVAVPVNTGIELTFDQDQTTGVESRFTIEPKVAGRFEQHGRIWSFVPDRPLAASTIYAVTVRKGVAVSGSDGVLEADVSFRFETAMPGPGVSPVVFARSILEVRPNEQPVVTVYGLDGEADIPATINVTVHRLPGFDALVDAARRLMGRDAWAIAAPSAVVATDGLTRVGNVQATIIRGEVDGAIHIPIKLAAGNYVLTLDQPGPPAQLLLQVTNLSAYTQVATSSTLVWVNDLATDAGVGNAKVAITGGSDLGSTAADGLLQVPTPAGLRKPAPRLFYEDENDQAVEAATLLTVTAPDGRRLLVPIGMAVGYAYWFYEGGYGGADSDWFVAFDSGRTTFRRTDTVNVLGVVRSRADRSVPTGVTVILRADDSPTEAAIERVPVSLSKRGVFTVNVPIRDLPAGNYNLDLLVGSVHLSSLWIDVTEIRKPAYQLDVETDRHALLAGDSVAIAAAATFFDGTPVPGVELTAEGFDRRSNPVTTDVLGAASTTLTSATVDDPYGWSTQYLSIRPTGAEEGDIYADALVTVFPSRSWIEAVGSLTAGRVVIDGTLSKVDVAAVEARLAAGLEVGDPAGAPIGGGTIKARIVHLIPIKTQVGTTYDFIEKLVVPIYDYSTKSVDIASPTLTSAADGTFHLSVAAPSLKDEYEVTLTATDAQGRAIVRTVYVVDAARGQAGPGGQPYLGEPEGCGFAPTLTVPLDDAIDATMHAGDGSVATGGRFLFMVARPSSVEADLQDAATFSQVLHDADLPGFDIRGVWLSRGTYFVADVRATVDPNDKTLIVTLQPDRARYEPGDTVTVKVRTTDPSGAPIPADVILQGIDEKLFKLGYANEIDVLPELLASPPSGFITSYRSHEIPRPDTGGCGDEGGGRDNFSDTVTFQRITTGADGRGSATFDLSDDLTSWRLTATAVSGKLDAGAGSVSIPVGLPFFVDATLAPEYLVGEQVILRARTYGSAMSAGDAVRITVSSDSLGLPATTVTGTAFGAVRVSLPAMTEGDHRIRIAAEATIGGRTYKDALIRTVHVTTSRLLTLQASYDPLDASFRPHGGVGRTTYVVTDAGRGRLIRPLEEFAWSTSARFDSATAAELARRLLVNEFGVPESSFPAASYDVTTWVRDGIALLPYSSSDVFLTARAALLAPEIVNSQAVRDGLTASLDDETSTEEARIAALAGLAGLGVDVLDRLEAEAPAAQAIRERLWLALGLAAAGDEAAARSIERSLLDAAGQRLGPWVRLHVGASQTDTLEGSGMLLMLAVALRDPIATDVSRYLDDHPSGEVIFPLEQLAYTRWVIDRLPRVAGRFAWTVGGERHEITLSPGGSYGFSLTASQVATLAMERLEGDLAVATSWTAPGDPLASAGGVEITRTVTPAGEANDHQLVHVVFDVSFGTQPVSGCYRLTDLVPSGLAPLASPFRWDDGGVSRAYNGPWFVSGQVVSWCASPSDLVHRYGYTARVVSPGTYAWEPAVIQNEIAPTVGTSIPARTYTIR